MATKVISAVGHWDGFFEVVGVKKPGGQGCWCMAYRDSRVPNDERAAYMQNECATKPGPGVLAYVDGEPAGWCSVAPRPSYRRLMNSRTIPVLDEQAWSIVCFVVRAGYRGQGLMHDLLDGAVAHASKHGAKAVEGYPAEVDGRLDTITGYMGTTALFEAHGFTRVAETGSHPNGGTRWIMRREL